MLQSTMVDANRSRRKPNAIAAAVILGSCAIFSLFDIDQVHYRSPRPMMDDDIDPSTARVLQRELSELQRRQPQDDAGIYPWAEDHAQPLSEMPRPSNETVLYWHMPKSAGSTAKATYRCLGKTIDVKSHPGAIWSAEEAGLVPSGRVDVVFSSLPDYTIKRLFDPAHRARAVAMFRHPVDRLVSKFYYLQVAFWEKSHRPEWRALDVAEWAESHNTDNNHMVKKLAGKTQDMIALEIDLLRAKETLRQRFIVGLVEEMEESIRRFNAVIMGTNDEIEEKQKMCMKEFFGKKPKRVNANAHPKVEKGSYAWEILSKKNDLDVQLYEYVLELFEEQRDVIDSYL